ncbi:MAG: response regulator [candidate division Zixibacteria bacterium]|nr:response regulator [candidate division Zixibacteria bacterium]
MKKILITDDDPNMLEIISMAFETTGGSYEILTASDGRKAMEMVKSHHPDLLILDLMMPNGHGYWVCREIRSDKSFDTMPILVLSAKYYPKDREEVLAMGANAFMTKPFALRQIVERSRTLMNEPSDISG